MDYGEPHVAREKSKENSEKTEMLEVVTSFVFLGELTKHGLYYKETRRIVAMCRAAMGEFATTEKDNGSKFVTKVKLEKTLAFSMVWLLYGAVTWTMRTAGRKYAFEMWCWRRRYCRGWRQNVHLDAQKHRTSRQERTRQMGN